MTEYPEWHPEHPDNEEVGWEDEDELLDAFPPEEDDRNDDEWYE